MANKKSKPPQKRPKAKAAAQKKETAQKIVAPTISVFFELRDVAGIRHHSDHTDIQRAQIAARMLITSTDISQAWVLRDVEIFTPAAG